MEVIFESKAILLQKISSDHQNESSASGLCWLVCKEVGLPLVQDSTQYFDRICNSCGRKICNLGQFYQFIKAAITSTASTPVKNSSRTKPAQHGENQNPFLSIRGQRSHPQSKVPRRLLKANQESLSFSRLEKIKVPKSLM